jgi:Protein of unknown function DUF262
MVNNASQPSASLRSQLSTNSFGWRAPALLRKPTANALPVYAIDLLAKKILLNQTDDAFYQNYLVQLRSARNPRGLPKSNQLLWEAFQYFKAKLDAIEVFNADGVRLAELLAETIGRQLGFILITVEDELNAYTVFETLNARGPALSTADLLKNYLFSRLKVQSDLEALQRRWRALIATVRQERFPEFLRYHLLCELPRIRTERRCREKSGSYGFRRCVSAWVSTFTETNFLLRPAPSSATARVPSQVVTEFPTAHSIARARETSP